MKKKLLLLFGMHFLLFGCASCPEQLGISDLEWESYSQERKERLLSYYNKVTKERESMLEREKENFDNVFLAVNIYGGKIMLPPAFINWQNYKPIQFKVFKGQCLDLEMKHLSDKGIKTILGVCYINNVLCLDPSRYDITKKFGTVTIPYSPLWLTGFTYKGIDSSGYVKLNNVTIKIQQKKAAFIKNKLRVD